MAQLVERVLGKDEVISSTLISSSKPLSPETVKVVFLQKPGIETTRNRRQKQMNSLNIVLVEPEIPQNTGNIARTCAATGAALHLVRPLGFEPDSAKLKRAGLDYWDKLDITYYDNLAAFLEQHGSEELWYFTTKAPRAFTDADYQIDKPVWIVFGKETAGLPEDLLHSDYGHCVRLPMRPGLRSLNLSNTVAVAVYEILRRRNYEGLESEGHLTKF